MTEFHLVVGPRRSGKSSFCNELIEELNGVRLIHTSKFKPKTKERLFRCIGKDDLKHMAKGPGYRTKLTPWGPEVPRGRKRHMYNPTSGEGKPDVAIMEYDHNSERDFVRLGLFEVFNNAQKVVVHKTFGPYNVLPYPLPKPLDGMKFEEGRSKEWSAEKRFWWDKTEPEKKMWGNHPRPMVDDDNGRRKSARLQFKREKDGRVSY